MRSLEYLSSGENRAENNIKLIMNKIDGTYLMQNFNIKMNNTWMSRHSWLSIGINFLKKKKFIHLIIPLSCDSQKTKDASSGYIALTKLKLLQSLHLYLNLVFVFLVFER